MHQGYVLPRIMAFRILLAARRSPPCVQHTRMLCRVLRCDQDTKANLQLPKLIWNVLIAAEVSLAGSGLELCSSSCSSHQDLKKATINRRNAVVSEGY